MLKDLKVIDRSVAAFYNLKPWPNQTAIGLIKNMLFHTSHCTKFRGEKNTYKSALHFLKNCKIILEIVSQTDL